MVLNRSLSFSMVLTNSPIIGGHPSHNPDTGTLETVCKCMFGFTDNHYAEMKDFYVNREKNINTSK